MNGHDALAVFLTALLGGSGIYGMKLRVLDQDKMILGALKCAKANGFTGEE